MRLGATRQIAQPAPTVFEFVAEVSNNPVWQKGMKRCEWITGGPIALGSRYRQEASFLGRSIISVFEVIEFEAGSRVVIDTIESTFPILVERRVEAVDETSCRVVATIDGGPSVPGFLQGVMGRMAQRSVNRDYDRLVEILEDLSG